MRTFLIIIHFWFCTGIAMAQYYGPHSEAEYAKWSLKFSPLGLFEPDQALTFASEFRPLSRLGIQLEGSYIFNTIYLSTNRTISNTNGFRVVPEIRYYDITFKRNLQRYVGLQLSYKQVSKDVEHWNYKTNYNQLETLHLKKNYYSAIFIGGLQNHGHLIGFDFNVGLGFKYKNLFNVPPNDNGGSFDTYLGETLTGYYPQLSATFKLCVKIL